MICLPFHNENKWIICLKIHYFTAVSESFTETTVSINRLFPCEVHCRYSVLNLLKTIVKAVDSLTVLSFWKMLANKVHTWLNYNSKCVSQLRNIIFRFLASQIENYWTGKTKNQIYKVKNILFYSPLTLHALNLWTTHFPDFTVFKLL